MILFDSPYTLVLLLAGAVLLWFGARLWSGVDGQQGRLFGASTLAVGGGWTISHALRTAAATPEAKWGWLTVEFATLAALPVLWFGYVLWYTDRWTPLGQRMTAGVALVATGFVALFVTNPSHGLVYEAFQVVEVGGHRIVTASLKPGFWAFVGFAYALVAASLLSLGATLLSTRGVMRWQVAALASLGSVPAIAAGVAVVDLGPTDTRAVVSGTALLVAVGCGVGVSRLDWADIAPIARDRALDAMSEIVLVVDGDGRIVDLNCSASSLVPGDPATAIGAKATTLVPSLSAVLDEDDDAPEPKSAAPRTVTAEADGEPRTFAVTVSSIGAARDTGARTVLLRDVTARKRAERRLRQERDRVERLHEIARDIGAARSVDAVCRVAAEGAAAALDCEAARVVAADGEALAATGVPGDRSELSASERELASRCCESGRGVVVDDLRDTRPAGRQSEPATNRGAVEPASNRIGDARSPAQVDSESTDVTAYCSAVAVPVDEETALQVLATPPSAFDDGDERALELLASHVATALERVAVESRLRDERDRLDEFAGIVSHDLRSPLNVAGGRVDLAQRNPDEAGEHLSAAKTALTRMEELVDDVLALARDGRAVGETEPVDLNTAVRRAWATVHTEGAKLTAADDLPVIRCDEARLREALENLFRNAVEHGSTSPRSNPPDGAEDPVTVTVGALDAGFYVADDGPGIPPDARESVFESGYSTSESGTGFGLSIVQQIAEAHGWTVELTSSDAGGARFGFVVDDDVVAEE